LEKDFEENVAELEEQYGQDIDWIFMHDSERVAIGVVENDNTKCFKAVFGELILSFNPDDGLYGDPVTKPNLWIQNDFMRVIFGDRGYTDSIFSVSELQSLRDDRRKLETIRDAFEILKEE